MKKLIMCILALMLIANQTVCFARGEAYFSISNGAGYPGDIVDITASIDCSEDFDSILIHNIEYDKAALELVDIIEGEIPNKMFVSLDKDNSSIIIGMSQTTTVLSEFVTIQFRIRDNAKYGDYVVKAATVAKKTSMDIKSEINEAAVTVFSNGENEKKEEIAVKIEKSEFVPVRFPDMGSLPDSEKVVLYLYSVECESNKVSMVDTTVKEIRSNMGYAKIQVQDCKGKLIVVPALVSGGGTVMSNYTVIDVQ